MVERDFLRSAQFLVHEDNKSKHLYSIQSDPTSRFLLPASVLRTDTEMAQEMF
jgi:hypothetical protein